ncbi:cupin domain-containing protein [Planctomicrobium sp. SH661]|uniref:cupin domain-containing protein n=1 Tax=Planctomicrobium sp. SH661 TaxID=3448124 RepID=UPI003F5B6171
MTRPETLSFITSAEVEIEDVPWCRCEWICRPGLVDTEQLLLVRADMPAGQGHRFHCHPHAEEIIYVLDGEVEQWVGQKKRLLKAGESAHIPKGVVHATFNRSEHPSRFLAILSPARFEGPATVDKYEEEPWCSLV